ncbi:hypothetical protein [Vibrio splendidus]|uniref:hypothetical protein n=1 Tax=Vibrio splendidus TaxID=29497 RepID=UPI003D0A5B67
MNNSATINKFYIHNNKLIGVVGDNSLGLVKGRFFSIEFVKQVEAAVYCELGFKYVLGTKGEKPLGDVLKELLFPLTVNRSNGSAIAKALEIGKQLTGEIVEPKHVSTAEHKTCSVSKYEWRILGRKIDMVETRSKLAPTSELHFA